jgi:RES domain-containing protein
MIVYRIASNQRVTDLGGEGARLFGGRWNPKGIPMLYTSANSSLAILEKLVHLNLDLIPENLRIVEISLGEDVQVERLDPSCLQEGWNEFPSPDYLAEYGRDWILAKRSMVLEVPSAINRLDSNYLVNPEHPDREKIEILKIHPLNLDKRLKWPGSRD